MHNKSFHKKIGNCMQDRIFLTANTLFMAVFTVIIVYPLLYIIFASFEGQATTMTLSLWPKKWSVAGYKAVIDYSWIWVGYLNSFIYTIVGTLIGLLVCICAAYPLSQSDLPGGGVIMGLFLFTMYFGGGLIPTYLNMRNLHMLDTMWSLVLPGAVSAYNMIVIRTYFKTQIPGELKEAAGLDGCGEWRYLLKIVMPLSLPILAVVGLYFAVGYWNSYFDAMIYIDTRAKLPLSCFLRDLLILNDSSSLTSSMDPAEIVSLQERQNVMKYALIVVSSLPMFILYPFIQKHFVKGIMIGAVKG